MRVVNRLLGLLLAIALVAGGVIALIEIAAAAAGSHDVIVPYQKRWRTVLEAHWTTGWVTLAGLVACLVGLLLLVPQLTRRRDMAVALRQRRAGVDVAVERRALERSLVSAVGEVDGVGRTSVRVHGDRVRVAIGADELREADLDQRVTDAAQKHLDGLDLATAARLDVRVTPKEATP